MHKSPTRTKGSAIVEATRLRGAFVLYCVFIVSYFLHLGDRVAPLGALRIDLLLCALTVMLIVLEPARSDRPRRMEPTGKLLLILCAYVVVSLPFVTWPGSVIDHGWEAFFKALLFYFFTVKTVTTQARLKWFLGVFIGVQVFRVLEPLYMHITTGYWGSTTNMGNWEFMDRLSGAPSDIINPNGLAFVILVAVAFLHNLVGKGTRKQQLLYVATLAPLLYALVLTGSRSGVLVMAVFAAMVIWRSKHRVVPFTLIAVGVAVLVGSLSDLERQRYLSIVDKNAKGAETAQGRVTGIWTDLSVGLERPVFGHGLGTSAEANSHAYGEAVPSHTLYTEVLQELGLVGLGLFVAFVYVTGSNCLAAVRATAQQPGAFLSRAGQGARDFTVLLVIFSVASYGLNEYQWYFLAGLSVVLYRLSIGERTGPVGHFGRDEGVAAARSPVARRSEARS